MHPPVDMILYRNLRRQRGLSLIELLIGITIGLLVVVAALGSLATTQVTSTTVGDSARLQQKANSAFRSMGFQLRQAGGIELGQNAGMNVVAYNGLFNGWNGTGANVAVTGAEGGGSVPDTLRMSYQDNGTSRDCLGNLVTTTPLVRVDNEYYVNAGKLMCKGADGATTQAIIDGVEDFQVTYGVRIETLPAVPAVLAASGAASSTAVPRQAASATYQQFTAATTSIFATPPYVQSVTVCLQLRGDLGSNAPTGGSIQGCSSVVAHDGYIRRAYRNTYSLRGVLL